MLIRRMTEVDVPQVAEIERLCFSRPWSEKGFLDSLALDYTEFLVAEIEGRIAGYIGIYYSAYEGEITNVAVHPDMRGKGTGKSLVHAMLEAAEEKKIQNIILEVRKSNDAAIHVYEQSGFESVGIRRGFYDLPKEDALIMNRKLDRTC